MKKADTPQIPVEQKVKEFQEKYQQLCEEYKMALNVSPVWVKRDDGSFSMVLKVSVDKLLTT